ncbi:MAG: DUF1365 domain-containing protein [Ferrovibrio sp.]
MEQMAVLPAASLYWGRVMHERRQPFQHRFSYRVFSLLLDIDRLAEIAAGTRLMRHNRFGLLGFYDRDHGPRDGSALRPWVEAALAREGLQEASARILIFCFPRLLGYVFNPLSIFYCYDVHDRLRAVLYEVKNTFGDQHGYLIEVPEHRNSNSAVEQIAAKRFHVSPFLPLEGYYRFHLLPPGEKIAISITHHDSNDAVQLLATQVGRRDAFSDHSLLRALIRHPLMTVKVIMGIHWEALQLWRKGAGFFRWTPPPGDAVSTGRSVTRE